MRSTRRLSVTVAEHGVEFGIDVDDDALVRGAGNDVEDEFAQSYRFRLERVHAGLEAAELPGGLRRASGTA